MTRGVLITRRHRSLLSGPFAPFPAFFSVSPRLNLLSAMDRLPAAAARGKEGSSVEIGWTNEKHATYLHSLEVSFVTRVFQSSAADQFQYDHLNGYDYHHQPLDRHLPDSCDSTLDSITLDLSHAKQYRDADPHHSKDKRSKKWKKRRTSLVQKASQKEQVPPESVTGSSSGHESAS
ncbi:uncharacterized protein LOC116246814 [Nymphaea colorata]|nr:uncharacterized protein LOC116246814 [Nymphaea colorata]